jgi:hypothetical protein
MKRPIDSAAATPLLFTALRAGLDPALHAYLQSGVPQSARFDVAHGAYTYARGGRQITCGGLVNTLRARYYPKYKDNRSKRKWKTTKVKGSTSAQGKMVDRQIAQSIILCDPSAPPGGKKKKVKKLNPMTVALLDYWRATLGHVLQAAQVPVELPNGWFKLTQADLITRDPATGRLWLYEVKTGMPLGFFRRQKEQSTFSGPELATANVECTKLNIWHLQLHYTRLALLTAGVPIFDARVVQIYQEEGKGLVLKVHEPPQWILDRIPLPPLPVPPLLPPAARAH